MAERICVGFVNLPGAEGEEWGEPEMQPYMAVIEGLQERLVCEGRGVTLEVFVELPHGVDVPLAPSDLKLALHQLHQLAAHFHGTNADDGQCNLALNFLSQFDEDGNRTRGVDVPLAPSSDMDYGNNVDVIARDPDEDPDQATLRRASAFLREHGLIQIAWEVDAVCRKLGAAGVGGTDGR